MIHSMRNVAAAFGVVLATLGPLAAQDALPRLSVTGEGIVALAPDMATIRVGVSEEARLAEDALVAMSDGLRVVLERLETAGIAERDVQTSQLSLSPRFERMNGQSRPRLVGYVAASTLTVRVRDIQAVGPVLDAVVSDGANRLEGISFGLSDTSDVEDEARRRAVADARAKAELLAAEAGVSLGSVIAITENGGMPAPAPMMRMEMAADAGVPIAEGEIETRIGVSIAWEIVN